MRAETILGLSVFVLGVLQAPILYYYASGPVGMFIAMLYMLAGLSLTIFFFKAVSKLNQNHRKKFVLTSLVTIGVISAIGGFFVDMEEIDWKWRMKEREAIVEKIKNGQIKTYGKITLVPLNHFPPISNGGNEIMVYSYRHGTYTVVFWIDRGLLDHSSQFVYTNDLKDEKRFDNSILKNEDHERFRKIKNNWYRLNQSALW